MDYGYIHVCLPTGLDTWTKKDIVRSDVDNQLFTNDSIHRAEIVYKCMTLAAMIRDGVPFDIRVKNTAYEYTFDISYKKNTSCVQGIF